MNNSDLPVDAETLAEVGPFLEYAAVMTLLSDDFARYTLVALYDRSTITLDRLAEFVVGLETAEGESIASPADLERARIRLHHATLPKLASMGYVRYDHEERRITREEIPDGVYLLLGIEE